MKYKIRYRTYHNSYPQLAESVSAVEARFFYIENGFVGIWTKHNRNQNQDPDMYVNIKDVLTIEPL